MIDTDFITRLKTVSTNINYEHPENIRGIMEDSIVNKTDNFLSINPLLDIGIFAWGSLDETRILPFPLYDVDYYGGIIVSSPQDINIALCINNEVKNNPAELYSFMIDIVLKTIKDFGIDCWVDKNDILTENGKICGNGLCHLYDEFIFSSVISLHDYKPIIDEIGLDYEWNKRPSYINVDMQMFINRLIKRINEL